MKNTLFLFTLILGISFAGPQAKTVKIDLKTFKKEVIGKEVQLVDVRSVEEYRAGHIDDAINIPIDPSDAFVQKFQELHKEKPVYIYCKAGGRSNKASKKLEDMGFQIIYDFSGGYSSWIEQ